jgi:DNA (cytosine-5)-methyltransferase 1
VTRTVKRQIHREAGRLAVSLFSGAGGLDLGLERAGWQLLAQVEMDPDAAETLRRQSKNRERPSEVFCALIESLDPADFRRSLGLRRGELSLLAGGPPCQPFTTSGLRHSIVDRRASSLFPAYLRFVDELNPRALLIENVDGMLSAALRHRPLRDRGTSSLPLEPDERKGSFLRWLLTELAARGYTTAWGVVEAADYEVPQMRQRAVLIGVRGNKPCFLPQPTHGRAGLPPYRTLRSALQSVTETGSVQPLSARKCGVYALVPPGGNWRNLPAEVQRATMGAAFNAEGGKSGWWRRLAWDLPAPTILGMPDHSSTALIHPDEVRCLSVNECAAVQTFPPGTEFAGQSRSQYQQIGNAVPVSLGEALGRQVAGFLDGHRSPVPPPPAWRQASANRRIGTHGWTTGGDPLTVNMNVKVRSDHVWPDGDGSF